MKTREIAEFLGAPLRGDGDLDVVRVASLAEARAGEIAFSEKAGEVSTAASCVILPAGSGLESVASSIEVADPKLAFARVAELLHPPKDLDWSCHPSAVIADSADLALETHTGAFVCVGERTTVGSGTRLLAGAKIGDDVSIGTNCVIHENVVIYDGSVIGNDVILHAGVVVGADGYGYVRGETEHVKFPQIGRVVIDNDVEIGANTCIDRGALGETRIGEGTKIDNLVQIAHNVTVGKRVIIAAQTGISGSTVLEDDCVIGGQVGMGDHATVKTGAVIGSQAGVLPGKIVRAGIWWGTPVQPLDEFKRQNAMVKGLGRLKAEVKQLRNRLLNEED